MSCIRFAPVARWLGLHSGGEVSNSGASRRAGALITPLHRIGVIFSARTKLGWRRRKRDVRGAGPAVPRGRQQVELELLQVPRGWRGAQQRRLRRDLQIVLILHSLSSPFPRMQTHCAKFYTHARVNPEKLFSRNSIQKVHLTEKPIICNILINWYALKHCEMSIFTFKC